MVRNLKKIATARVLNSFSSSVKINVANSMFNLKDFANDARSYK
jgi:hypothetical protein